MTDWIKTLDRNPALKAPYVESELRSMTDSYPGFQFTITARPRSNVMRPREGARSLGIVMQDTLGECRAPDYIRRAISRKAKEAKKCQDLNLPYIVAVDVFDELIDSDDMVDGLFGSISQSVWKDKNGTWQHRTQRIRNGAWHQAANFCCKRRAARRQPAPDNFTS